MNDGLKILLERMDTNPEEFLIFSHSNRWDTLFRRYEPYLTAEEKAGWVKKVTELNRQAFTNEVMKELLMADGEDEIEKAVKEMDSSFNTLGFAPSMVIVKKNTNSHLFTVSKKVSPKKA
jgi:hypothetical protein